MEVDEEKYGWSYLRSIENEAVVGGLYRAANPLRPYRKPILCGSNTFSLRTFLSARFGFLEVDWLAIVWLGAAAIGGQASG